MSHRFDLPAIGPPASVLFPAAVRATVANGLKVMAMSWPAVPVVSIALVFPQGAATDPSDRPGLTGFVADMLDEGAGSRDTVELAEAFARLGTQLDVEVGSDTTVVGVTTLARHFGAALDLIADVVYAPHIDAAGLHRVRELRSSRLKQLSRTPSAPADRALLRAIFGDRPYGHGVLGTTRALEALSLDDVRARWQASYQPAGATLIVAGDLAPERAADVVAASGLGAPRPAVVTRRANAVDEDVTRNRGPVIWLVERSDAPQSEVRIGHLGPARNTADYHALVTLNALLGGQFTSRINRNLRESRGITYGARSAFDFRRDAGSFECAASVQADATAVAVSEIRREMAGVRIDGAIEPSEIATAKASLTRGYARGFETARQLVRAATHLVTYDLPADTFDRFVPGVDALIRDDLTRAAERYLDPDAAAVVVVGDRRHIGALSELGRVEMVEPEF